MGGKSNSSNDAVVREQQSQADEARTKETARQDRINTGLANIKAAFEGGKTYSTPTTSKYTFSAPTDANTASGSQVTGLPAGYTYVRSGGTGGSAATPGTTAKTVTYSGNSPGQNNKNAAYVSPDSGNRIPGGGSSGGSYGATYGTTGGTPAVAATPVKWQVRAPDGKLYDVGASGEITTSGVTGTQSGFDDAFYNKYRQGYLDNLTPQVQQQYADAKDKLTYDLARAGTGRSSVANDETAKLAEQNTLANANVQSTADTAAADLRNRVASEKAKAESQLYATENPDVATNTALAAVNNISLAKPESTTLGDMFKTALIGGANAVTGYKNQSFNNRVADMLKKSGSSVVSS